MMKTRIYTVHLLDTAPDDGPVLVKEGFNWPAFFIAVPWALFHRMWWLAGFFVVLQIGVGTVSNLAHLNEMQQGVISFALALAIGFAADELRRGALRRRGYSFEDVVVEQNSDRALRRFLDARPVLAARLASAPL